MTDLPARPDPPSPPMVSAWSHTWVRALVLLGLWIGVALFFFMVNADHARPGHQALAIVAWGVIGVAFGALWFVIEGALSSWMDRNRMRHRRFVAWCCYVVFFAVMIVVLSVVSSGADPNDWRVMAWIAFLVVAAFPSPAFLQGITADPTSGHAR